MTFDPANPLGIHEGISDELYSQAAGLRRSELKTLWEGQPADLLHYRKFGIPDSPDLLFGRALDCAVLTPHEFTDRFVVAPEINRRTNAGKASWEAFLKDAGKRDVLTAEQGEMAQVCTAAVWSSSQARGLLEGSARQLSAWWNASTIGGHEVLCKTRPDAAIEEHGRTVDLKSAADFSDNKFARAAWDYAYDIQAYMNWDGFKANNWEWKEHAQIVVRKPTNRQRVDVRCFVWTAESPWISSGEQRFDALLHRYQQMCEHDDARGWADVTAHLPMPKWIAAEVAFLEETNNKIRSTI